MSPRRRSGRRRRTDAEAALAVDAAAAATRADRDDWAAALASAGLPELAVADPTEGLVGAGSLFSAPTAPAAPIAPAADREAPQANRRIERKAAKAAAKAAAHDEKAAAKAEKAAAKEAERRAEEAAAAAEERAVRDADDARLHARQQEQAAKAERAAAAAPTSRRKAKQAVKAAEAAALTAPLPSLGDEHDQPSSVHDPGAIDVERALRLVRMAAAIIAMAAALGARGESGTGLNGPAAAAAIFAGAMAINLFTAWTHRRGWRTLTSLAGLALDVAGSLALVFLLDAALDGSSWMVLLLPIVMGGVRFGASGTLLAWTIACAGYLALVLTGVVDVSGSRAEEFGSSLQRFAFLLALAVPVAALTQWLQHRWEHQRNLTMAAQRRAQRLELVESLARGFIGSSEPKLLANLADAGLRLGFETVTITLHSGTRSMTVAAMGASRRLPTDDVAVRPEPGETLVTHWSGDDGADDEGGPLTSVSILLDAPGNAITLHGWSTAQVDEDLARAFGLLGAHAKVALKATRLLAELERQAKQDGLTGLLNRRAFDEHVDRQAAAAASVALLLLDVDFFKQINDTYGHQAGDRVLRVIAERLRAAAASPEERVDAAVARIGGDEFALLLTDAPLEVVADVADHIEASMTEPVAIGTEAVRVSFSIGIADASGTWNPRDLIAAADEATYQAKTHGRNRSCWAAGPVGPDPDLPTPGPTAHRGEPGPDPLISLLERSMDTTAAPAHTPPTQRPLR